MWLRSWILSWLTALRQRQAIVNKEPRALMQESALKKTKVQNWLHAPRHPHRLSVSPVLPSSLPLDFLRRSLSSCRPAHVTSAALDQHETLQRQGRPFHTSPPFAWLKTGHDTKINRGAALEWCSTVCVLKQGWQSAAAFNIFPRPAAALDSSYTNAKSYKMRGESITWWTHETVCTLPLISSASIRQPPELRAARGWTNTVWREGRQFMHFDQSQMCASVRDPGKETWDIVLLRGLAWSAHLSSVCVVN